MKKLPAVLFLMILLSACGAVGQDPISFAPPDVKEQVAFPPALASSTPVATSTITPTPTPNAVQTALVVIEIDRATSTAAAAATSTQEARLSTQEARATEAFWVNVTLSVSTQQAYDRHIAETASAATAQANWKTQQPPTQTALAATQIIEQDQFNSKRWATWIGNVGGAIAGMAALAVLVYGFYGLIKWLQKRGDANIQDKSQIKPDPQGRYPVIPEDAIPGKTKRVVNPNLMHRSVLDPNGKDDLTTEQALSNTANARRLEMVRSVAASPAMKGIARDLMKRSDGNGTQPTNGVKITKPNMPLLTHQQESLPLPDWSVLANSWDGKKLPYGVGTRGLLLADPAEEPHWLIVGRTRSGKSRYGLRTIAAAALTMGYQVLFVGEHVDFFPFEGHPNAKIVDIDLNNDPGKYLEILRRVSILMSERNSYLIEHRQSTWQQAGMPELYVVLDEFSSAIKQLNVFKSGAGNLVSTMATVLIQKGGKYGINVIQVAQDATGTNIDITGRRNMGRMVFRVSEQKSSDVALGVNGEPSAMGLPRRHFLSSIGDSPDITLGVAFAPSDEEIQAFLKERSVPAQPPMDWVDGIARNIPIETKPISDPVDAETFLSSLPKNEDGLPITIAQANARKQADEIIQREDKILSLYLDYLERKEKPNLAAIAREVFDRKNGESTGGTFYGTVAKVLADYERVSVEELAGKIAEHVAAWNATTSGATTGENVPGMPVPGPIPA